MANNFASKAMLDKLLQSVRPQQPFSLNPNDYPMTESAPVEPINPTLKTYLQKKMTTKPAIEAQPLQSAAPPSVPDMATPPSPQDDGNSNTAEFLAGVGAAIAGKDVGKAQEVFDQRRFESARNKQLEFDKEERKLRLAESKKQQDIDNAFREKQLKENIDARKEIAGIRRSEQQAQGKELSPEQKKTVETLATKNANKLSIANQIDAVMANWEGLNDSDKVIQGRQLLKTLNSPEGADAVGAEEAKRLGAQLEFAMGNLTNSNPVQFGRDLEGFGRNAILTSQAIKKGVEANQDLIDQTLGQPLRTRPKQSTFPRQVRKGNQTATVSNEDELNEALSEGFQ